MNPKPSTMVVTMPSTLRIMATCPFLRAPSQSMPADERDQQENTSANKPATSAHILRASFHRAVRSNIPVRVCTVDVYISQPTCFLQNYVDVAFQAQSSCMHVQTKCEARNLAYQKLDWLGMQILRGRCSCWGLAAPRVATCAHQTEPQTWWRHNCVADSCCRAAGVIKS